MIVVGCVILVAGIVALCIALSGMKNGDYYYVALNTQADVEMLLNKNYDVVSVYPQNEKAEILLSDTDYVGQDIRKVIPQILEDSCKLNYIDVNSTSDGDNAVKMTVVSGITNALEMNVYSSINNYFLDNGIFCVIVENETDQKLLEKSSQNNVSSPDKYSLIKSIVDKNAEADFDKLKGKSEEELIDIIHYYHTNYEGKNLSEEKEELISANIEKYNAHKNILNDEYLREFGSDYTKYTAERTKEFKLNFPY